MKIWKDNGNAYNTRPEELQLTLWRSITPEDEESWEKVTDAVPCWTGTDTDTWTYVYTGLPVTDDMGNPYTYQVEESVPETGDEDDTYELAQDGWQLINTLTDTIDIPVTKIWRDSDNASGERPDEIEVILFANGEEVRRAVLRQEKGILERIADLATGQTNTWSYTFTELPEYDAEGVRIEYTMRPLPNSGRRRHPSDQKEKNTEIDNRYRKSARAENKKTLCEWANRSHRVFLLLFYISVSSISRR